MRRGILWGASVLTATMLLACGAGGGGSPEDGAGPGTDLALDAAPDILPDLPPDAVGTADVPFDIPADAPLDAPPVDPALAALQQGLAAMDAHYWYADFNLWFRDPTNLEGLLDGTNQPYWWQSANAVEVLVDYARLSGDTSGDARLAGIYDFFVNPPSFFPVQANFLNDYNDDSGWWAIAWMKEYDRTGDPRHLAIPRAIFDRVSSQWQEAAGGGIPWNTTSTYLNSVTNGLFMIVAARLAVRTGDPSYLDWAKKDWAWYSQAGIFDPGTGVVFDAAQNHDLWTYNQGVVLGGLTELYLATKGDEYLDRAMALADAAMTHPALQGVGGVLKEGKPPDPGDQPLFKGIFLRYLQQLRDVLDTSDDPGRAACAARIHAFIDFNVAAMQANARDADGMFADTWEPGVVHAWGFPSQVSAMAALLAGL